jgi:Bacterial sugar transferase
MGSAIERLSDPAGSQPRPGDEAGDRAETVLCSEAHEEEPPVPGAEPAVEDGPAVFQLDAGPYLRRQERKAVEREAQPCRDDHGVGVAPPLDRHDRVTLADSNGILDLPVRPRRPPARRMRADQQPTCAAGEEGEEIGVEGEPVLRRTHLDEPLQLWNVIRGDMSIVAAAREPREFVTRLESTVPFWNRRLLVKPGLIGRAQLRRGYAADDASAAEKLSYDLWYIRHGGLAVDVAVCLQTVRLVLDAFLPRRPFRHRRLVPVSRPAALPTPLASAAAFASAQETEVSVSAERPP